MFAEKLQFRNITKLFRENKHVYSMKTEKFRGEFVCIPKKQYCCRKYMLEYIEKKIWYKVEEDNMLEDRIKYAWGTLSIV